MKIDSHAWLEIVHGENFFVLKTMKNIKIANPVLTMNSFDG